jgi:hypothetical protein
MIGGITIDDGAMTASDTVTKPSHMLSQGASHLVRYATIKATSRVNAHKLDPPRDL